MTPNEKLRALLWERGGRRCGICGKDLELFGLHVDHVIPLSAGGLDSPENLQVSHARCNISKGGQNRIRAYEKKEQAIARRAAEIEAKAASLAVMAETKAAGKQTTCGMEAAELIRRREGLGLSRRALARVLDVDQSTVWRWEVDGKRPNAVMNRHLEQTLARLERRRQREGGSGGTDESPRAHP
jgi:DNA-binding transcriptional regulator YiaG